MVRLPVLGVSNFPVGKLSPSVLEYDVAKSMCFVQGFGVYEVEVEGLYLKGYQGPMLPESLAIAGIDPLLRR